MKRTTMKRGSSSLKSTKGLKRGSGIKKKPLTSEQRESARVQREKDWEFYTRIFQKRGNTCQACSITIYGELTTANADHLLEKSKYKHLRYEEDNIAIVCWDCHAAKTNGGKISEDYKQLIEQAKQKFNV